MLARIHSNLGNALHFLGRNVEAEVAHRTALAEFQALVERNPRSAESRERLAVAYSNLAWVLRGSAARTRPTPPTTHRSANTRG